MGTIPYSPIPIPQPMNIELISFTPNPQQVIAEAARTCYLSFNKQTEESDRKLIRQLIRRGHLSVLEHATATFRVRGCSRAFTHQLVRHRLCSFSQQSQRYVKEEGFAAVTPPRIKDNPEALIIYNEMLEKSRWTYRKLIEMGIRKEDARFILPNAVVSEIIFSANFRQLRHMLILRGNSHAQWEIREVFIRIGKILKEIAPDCFFDLVVDEEKDTIARITGAENHA
ncbi:MAG: FAD-dependent thymidylate synthase [Candidatus Auribacterota bacterium]|nr:FAD-dependent thymidylate synthase [Candidatus Auribacterota bacterium]